MKALVLYAERAYVTVCIGYTTIKRWFSPSAIPSSQNRGRDRNFKFGMYNYAPRESTVMTQSVVVALVLSRLDYCNSVLAGLSANLIWRLQSVQNAAAWLIFRIRCSYREPWHHSDTTIRRS